MKVVIAIDSLKGSLTSIEAGNAVRQGILKAIPDAEIIVKPLADGGEGTTEALVEGYCGEFASIKAKGPLSTPVNAIYGILPKTKTAVIEVAAASGITLISDEDKNPLCATTYGVGEMIKDAISRGCRDFIIGIGGSATNDGGLGMLSALGFKFFDSQGMPVGEGGAALAKIASISTKDQLPQLKDCSFKVACDVNNPLYGHNGATYIFGPQKGVNQDMLEELDQGMKNYAAQTKKCLKTDYANFPGSGAAGGLGFALISYLNATLTPGIDLILDAIDLKSSVVNADYVVTGEGRLDHQTAMGKAPVGVAKLAKKYGAKVIALAGSVTKDAAACNDEGIDAFFCILNSVVTLEEAMQKETAADNISSTGEQIFRLIKSSFSCLRQN